MLIHNNRCYYYPDWCHGPFVSPMFHVQRGCVSPANDEAQRHLPDELSHTAESVVRVGAPNVNASPWKIDGGFSMKNHNP